MVMLLGWLFLILPLLWMTVAAFFFTVPTFGEALFSGKWWEKLLGVAAWVFVLFCWYQWLSAVSLDFNVEVTRK